MRYSQMFGKTIRKPPSDAVAVSHKLLIQAGFIRESSSGRFFILPLGQLVQQKIMQIVKKEMDEVGAQEMLTPVLHPLELWKETNRTKTTGFELMKIADRRNAEFALGGTAEEMMVDVVRRFQLSYKDLPFNIYQFSTKFRDELRSRGGLLRVREFIMKDAYSFDSDEHEFKKTYEQMKKVYSRIFTNMGLTTRVVESDNGYIGGEYCHEFVVDSPVGETAYLIADDGSYASHEEVALFQKEEKNSKDTEKPMVEVEAKRGTTMKDGELFHKEPLWNQIKDVLFVDDQKRFILAVLRGDLDVNEVKLMHVTKSVTLRPATDKEIRSLLHSEPGFLSPVGIKEKVSEDVNLLIVGDTSLRTAKNMYGGANKLNTDLLNVNIDRDYTLDIEADIALAHDGYLSTSGKKLVLKRGIEVGNVFQLGYHYTTRMKKAVFTSKDGTLKPYYMGCYGIGIGRAMATVVEVSHDDKGIIWPKSIAPYAVHLILVGKEEDVVNKAEKTYEELTKKNVSVLFDDRLTVGAGEKLADADLIGIPIRLVVSKRTGDKVEIKKRSEKESKLITLEECISF